MQCSPFRFGPVILSATLTTNILNPPTTTGGVGAGTPNAYILLKHVRWVNKTALSATFSHWLGATGGNVAGTEIFGIGKVVLANDSYDWYGNLKIKVADFLVGGSGTAASITIEGEGEIGVEL